MSRILLDKEMSIKEMSLSELFTLMEMASEEYKKRVDSLSDNLSIIDRETLKISHEIETSAVGTVDGYKLMKNLREARRIRRIIKNDIGFMRRINRDGFSIERVEHHMNLGRNQFFTSEEQRQSQRDYSLFDKLGVITQIDVENYLDGCLDPLEDSIINLADRFNNNNCEVRVNG